MTEINLKDCKHKHALWKNAINEDGWVCFNCDYKFGFSPMLDQKLIRVKVRNILTDMHEGEFVYISNGSMGDAIVSNVTIKCRKTKRFDQHSIIEFIIKDPNLYDHWIYWKKQAKKYGKN